jgi:hypothetical protein
MFRRIDEKTQLTKEAGQEFSNQSFFSALLALSLSFARNIKNSTILSVNVLQNLDTFTCFTTNTLRSTPQDANHTTSDVKLNSQRTFTQA